MSSRVVQVLVSAVVLVVISVSVSLSTVRGFSTNGDYFIDKKTICHVDTRVKDGCSREVASATSVLACLSRCQPQEFCMGASVDPEGRCYHHEVCLTATDPCRDGEPTHVFWERFCVHGHWNSSARACSCLNGAWGKRCDKYPQSCYGLVQADFGPGQFNVILDLAASGGTPLKVVCRITKTYSAAVLIARNNGQFNFNKTWSEYVNGFYMDSENFWSGLRNWHYLSYQGSFTRLVIALSEDKFGTNDIVYYDDFFDCLVEGEQKSFSISAFWHTGIPNDRSEEPYRHCLKHLQRVPFSTWDLDNTGNGTDWCASHAAFGWWFPPGQNCRVPCNLLGRQPGEGTESDRNTTRNPQVIHWLNLDWEGGLGTTTMFLQHDPRRIN